MQLAEPLPPPQNMQPYLDAANAQVPTLFLPTASMPTFLFEYHGNANNKRVGAFDTGCNVNLMSKKAFLRDKHLFAKAVVKDIKPFRVNLADGRSKTVTMKVVAELKIVIGKSFYLVTFLVVDELTTDFLIGWPFMLQYDVQLKPKQSVFSLGIPPNNLLDPNYKRPYQTQDLAFETKNKSLSLWSRLVFLLTYDAGT